MKGFKLKKGFKQFSLRLIIFLLLGFLIIPFLFEYIARNIGSIRTITVNYTYMPLFISAILVIFILHERKKLFAMREYSQNISETVAFSLISLLSFAFYFVFSYLISADFAKTYLYQVIALNYLSYTMGAIFLGFAVFNFRFFKKFQQSLLISIITGTFFFAFTYILRLNWRFFSGSVANIVYWMLGLMFNNAYIDFSKADPSLILHSFSVIIGSPCSGVASLTLFASLYIAIAALDWKILNKRKLAVLFIPGLVGMFMMTILRIFSLMIIGAFMSKDIAFSLFHSNLGWILFVVYLLGFWYFAYPYLKK